MKKLVGVVSLLLITGCYTTRVAGAGISFDTLPESAVHSNRQWFALGGLADLTNAAGSECQHGLAAVESEVAGTDILINIGLGLLGGAATYAACSGEDDATRWSCFSAGATFVPWLLGSRTVHYVCRDALPGSQPEQAAPPAPPAPPLAPEDVPANLQPTPDEG